MLGYLGGVHAITPGEYHDCDIGVALLTLLFHGLPTTSAVELIIGGVGGILVIVVVMKRDMVKGECCNFGI